MVQNSMYCTVQYRVHYATVQYSTVHHSTARYSAVLHSRPPAQSCTPLYCLALHCNAQHRLALPAPCTTVQQCCNVLYLCSARQDTDVLELERFTLLLPHLAPEILLPTLQGIEQSLIAHRAMLQMMGLATEVCDAPQLAQVRLDVAHLLPRHTHQEPGDETSGASAAMGAGDEDLHAVSFPSICPPAASPCTVLYCTVLYISVY